MRQNRNQCRPCSAHRDPSLRSFAAQTSKNRSQNPVFPQPAKAETQHFLQEAVNDYTARSQNLDVLELLEQLGDRPELPNVITSFMKACSS